MSFLKNLQFKVIYVENLKKKITCLYTGARNVHGSSFCCSNQSKDKTFISGQADTWKNKQTYKVTVSKTTFE
jgi:hypothetical protein